MDVSATWEQVAGRLAEQLSEAHKRIAMLEAHIINMTADTPVEPPPVEPPPVEPPPVEPLEAP